jgi:hypothetical protein
MAMTQKGLLHALALISRVEVKNGDLFQGCCPITPWLSGGFI